MKHQLTVSETIVFEGEEVELWQELLGCFKQSLTPKVGFKSNTLTVKIPKEIIPLIEALIQTHYEEQDIQSQELATGTDASLRP